MPETLRTTATPAHIAHTDGRPHAGGRPRMPGMPRANN